jgi:hypothetical protein
VHEIKHAGFRFICRRDGDRVCVFSRRGNDYTDRVPAIAEALAVLRVKSVTIDGEGVVCRPDGVSDFDRLRAAVGRLGRATPSCTRSTYSKSMARICDFTNGTFGGRRFARRLSGLVRASVYPNTWTVTARSHSSTPAPWGSKGSSPSAAIDRIGRVGRRIGSR